MLRTRVTALLCRATVRSSTNYVSLARTRSFHSQSILLKTAATDITSTQYSRIFNPDLKNIDRPLDTFARRHLGPSPSDVKKMLKTMGYSDLNAFIEELVPPNILKRRPLKLEAPSKGFCEQEMLQHLEKIANKNHYKVKNFIGKGYYGTILPPVIQRNLLESPEWYTSYTPYQPEISQGRLEALLNFQTVVSDLTGLPVANASLLDEGTAAGEAMLLSFNISRKKKLKYVIDKKLHQQTKSVLHTRAKPFNIEIIEVDCSDIKKAVDVLKNPDVSGCLVQYPATDGSILPPDSMKQLSDALHSHKSLLSVASDLMALTLLKPPAHYGADIVLGSSQRFGVPMGYGGPHAAFFAVIDKLNRKIPGRIVGISKDRLGKTALRLALKQENNISSVIRQLQIYVPLKLYWLMLLRATVFITVLRAYRIFPGGYLA